MNILLYIALFLIGTIVGNFWQKAIYRIPRNISILKKGVANIEPENKSKYSEKIVQLFFMLLGGFLFFLFGKLLEINIDSWSIEQKFPKTNIDNWNNWKISSIIMYLFTILYLSILVIIAGIDKKFINIDKKVITCGMILSMIYIVYLYIIDSSSIYFNIVCLGLYIIWLIMDTIFLRKYAQNSYTIGILMLFNMILIFSEVNIFAYTMAITAIEILLYLLIQKINQKKNGNKKVKTDNIPVGYFVSASNIIVLLASAIIQSI